jgi:hypothetical protein
MTHTSLTDEIPHFGNDIMACHAGRLIHHEDSVPMLRSGH